MNLLAIESATNLVGAAVAAGEHVAERSHQGGRRHAESLIPAIEEVCALAGLRVDQLEVVAVDVGPGLFTGLRVGVATAKALAQGLGIGVLAVSSLDVLAASAVELAGVGTPLTVVSAVDARRGEVFVARYAFAVGGPDAGADAGAGADPDTARQGPPEVLTPEALATRLAEVQLSHSGRLVVVGDGAVRYLDQLSMVGTADLTLAERASSPSPVMLARLAVRRLKGGWEVAPPMEVVPDYRREADARINWEQRTPPTARVPS
jgi:tRNA threonylcarbamoyladenosine biosynthesis protein TsaB